MTKKKDQVEKRIADLTEKLNQAKAQKQALDARQKEKERREETQAKIILGGLALKNIEIKEHGQFTDALLSLVKKYTDEKKHAVVMKYVEKALEKSEQAEFETTD